MSASEETLALLRSIDASLKVIAASVRARAPKAVASDRDLDGPHGDPVLKFMPRDWSGASFKGSRFSQCPADLLDLVAETCEYFAAQAEAKGETTGAGKPVAPYKRADAARARGWAARIRAGKVTPATATPDTADEMGEGDDWAPGAGW